MMATPAPDFTDNELDLLEVPLDSPALNRLLDEVRHQKAGVTRSYNRIYSRHNR